MKMPNSGAKMFQLVCKPPTPLRELFLRSPGSCPFAALPVPTDVTL